MSTQSSTKQRTAATVLTESYLDVRCRLLDIAATLDRIDHAADGDAGSKVRDSDQWQTISRALEILASDHPDRAARLQKLFSRPYDKDWRARYQLPGGT